PRFALRVQCGQGSHCRILSEQKSSKKAGKMPANRTEECVRSASSKENFGDAIDVLIQAFQVADCFLQRHADDASAAHRRHMSPHSSADHLVSFDSEARREDSIECRGRAAPLHVSKFRDPCLNVGAAFYFSSQVLADAAESIMPIK